MDCPSMLELDKAKELIQLARASSERLICAPSVNLIPLFCVALALSEPARSINEILHQS